MSEAGPDLLPDSHDTLAERPLYHEFAWAYDVLFDDDVGPFTDRVVEALAAHGVQPGSEVLDAGCGTGRYAGELARRGFVVKGIDASEELVAYGNESNVPDGADVHLSVGDLRGLAAPESFDAIVCRGVLNDLLDEDDRSAVIARLAASLRSGGVLVLDVRDWLRTVESVRQRPLFEKTVAAGDSPLDFRSDRTIDEIHKLLVSRETISSGQQKATSTFRMRPWTEHEIRVALERAGCHEIAVTPGFRDRGEQVVGDRIFCTSVRR